MASKGVQLCLLLVLVVTFFHRTKAQSGCTSTLMSLAPCLNYVTGNSFSPSSSCCSQLTIVVQSQPRCLCAMLNGGGSSLGITINQTLALSLPGACHVQTPPVSRCNAANGPATSPISSPISPPIDSSDETPEAPTTTSMPSIPAGSWSKTVPTADGTSESDASIIRVQLHLTILVLSIATYASNFIRF